MLGQGELVNYTFKHLVMYILNIFNTVRGRLTKLYDWLWFM